MIASDETELAASAANPAEATAPQKTAPRAQPIEPGPELPVGTMVGDYRIDRKIADGGMATVYEATHQVIAKRAAVKVMHPQLCGDAVSVERFLTEARAVNQIGHANIVDVFAVGQLNDGRHYMLMEWLVGETLAERLRRGPMPLATTLEILDQVCDALEAAHEKRIVHRDLKPDNIYLVESRRDEVRVKLLDFGVAKLLARRASMVTGEKPHTVDGAYIGTPTYMSPEQAAAQPVDGRADVYSLGVTAFEMIAGQVPFDAGTTVDVLSMHLHDAPPSLRSLRPSLPPALEALVFEVMAKSPAERPSLAAVRQRIAALRPAAALLDEREASLALPTAAWRRLSLLWGGGLVVLLAAAGVAATLRFRAPVAQSPSPSPSAWSSGANTSTRPPLRLAPMVPAVARHQRLNVSVGGKARVELDGALVGDDVDHVLVEVERPGSHTLVVSAPGHRAVRHSVYIAPGATVALSLNLPVEAHAAVAVPVAAPAAAPTAAPVTAPIAPPAAAPNAAPAAAPKRSGDDYMLDPFAKPHP